MSSLAAKPASDSWIRTRMFLLYGAAGVAVVGMLYRDTLRRSAGIQRRSLRFVVIDTLGLVDSPWTRKLAEYLRTHRVQAYLLLGVSAYLAWRFERRIRTGLRWLLYGTELFPDDVLVSYPDEEEDGDDDDVEGVEDGGPGLPSPAGFLRQRSSSLSGPMRRSGSPLLVRRSSMGAKVGMLRASSSTPLLAGEVVGDVASDGEDRDTPLDRLMVGRSASPSLPPKPEEAPEMEVRRVRPPRGIGDKALVASVSGCVDLARSAWGPRGLRSFRHVQHTLHGLDLSTALVAYEGMELVQVPPGGCLFQPGDGTDDGVFVVLRGRVGVHVAEADPGALVKGSDGAAVRDASLMAFGLDPPEEGGVGGGGAAAAGALAASAAAADAGGDVMSSSLDPIAFPRHDPLVAFFPQGSSLGENGLLAGAGTRRPVGAWNPDRSPATVLRLRRPAFLRSVARHPRGIVSFVAHTTARQWRVARAALEDVLSLPEAAVVGREPARRIGRFEAARRDRLLQAWAEAVQASGRGGGRAADPRPATPPPGAVGAAPGDVDLPECTHFVFRPATGAADEPRALDPRLDSLLPEAKAVPPAGGWEAWGTAAYMTDTLGLEFRHVEAGHAIYRRGDVADAVLILWEGTAASTLSSFQPPAPSSSSSSSPGASSSSGDALSAWPVSWVRRTEPGDLLGGLAALARIPHRETAVAGTACTLLVVPRALFQPFPDAMRGRNAPLCAFLASVTLKLGRMMTPLLRTFLGLGLQREWTQAGASLGPGGKATASGTVRLVMHGRVRVGRRVAGRGDVVRAHEAGKARCLRDVECVRFSRPALDHLTLTRPRIGVRVSQVMSLASDRHAGAPAAHVALGSSAPPVSASVSATGHSPLGERREADEGPWGSMRPKGGSRHVKTIALLPAGTGEHGAVRLAWLAARLCAALPGARLVTRGHLEAALGVGGRGRALERTLAAGWLSELEEEHATLILLSDTDPVVGAAGGDETTAEGGSDAGSESTRSWSRAGSPLSGARAGVTGSMGLGRRGSVSTAALPAGDPWLAPPSMDEPSGMSTPIPGVAASVSRGMSEWNWLIASQADVLLFAGRGARGEEAAVEAARLSPAEEAFYAALAGRDAGGDEAAATPGGLPPLPPPTGAGGPDPHGPPSSSSSSSSSSGAAPGTPFWSRAVRESAAFAARAAASALVPSPALETRVDGSGLDAGHMLGQLASGLVAGGGGAAGRQPPSSARGATARGALGSGHAPRVGAALFAQRVLLLLHPGSTQVPEHTRKWLRQRRVTSHLHLRVPGGDDEDETAATDLGPSSSSSSLSAPGARAPSSSSSSSAAAAASAGVGAARDADEEAVRKTTRKFVHPAEDVSRIARFLVGKAVGVVLGGGGARGLAHVGVLRRLLQDGVPVDAVGGTSQGAFVSAAFAVEAQWRGTEARVKRFSRDVASPATMLAALTLPVVAYFNGGGFNEAIQDALGASQIEDLWVPYFCVSTNVSRGRMEVHRTGPLWRFVRASMTVLGLLPPIMDGTPRRDLLVDGGYASNLPIEWMLKSFPSVERIVAVDVEDKHQPLIQPLVVRGGSSQEPLWSDYGDSVSGWWLAARWLAAALYLGPPLRVPNMSHVSLSLSYISHTMALRNLLETAAREGGVDADAEPLARDRSDAHADAAFNFDSVSFPHFVYLHPEVQGYGLLDYGRWSEIVAQGYLEARRFFPLWAHHAKIRRERPSAP